MSYFAVISGKNATLVEVTAGRLVPISEAQSYLVNLEQGIAAADGSPSFFWDDNKTGTSHELISDVDKCLFEERSVETSALAHLIQSCESHNVAARVWWASNEPDAFSRVVETNSAVEALALLQQQAGKGAGIGFVLHPNYSLKRTADVGTV